MTIFIFRYMTEIEMKNTQKSQTLKENPGRDDLERQADFEGYPKHFVPV